MCGIVGIIDVGASFDISTRQLEGMLNRIYHRGPDCSGMWIDKYSYVALGHRRLSVLDTTSAGHQPMASPCNRFIIVFNGEIYNHIELRKKLEQTNNQPAGGWRGHSDTETLLICFSVWGVEKTLQLVVGMFALALWDKKLKCLTLARDRVGEKPLHYGWQNNIFLFGSELKSLTLHSSFQNVINWEITSTFLSLNYIPAPHTIYKGIYKLPPGTYLQLSQADIQQATLPQPVSYWSLANAAKDGLENPFIGSFYDAVDELDVLIRQAVQLQSVADVSLGAFLSGGIDSSTVVAMLQLATTSKVKTFSIGMPDSKLNESEHARAVAKHLGTTHYEHIIKPNEALDLIPQLSNIWDEPFADSSQIPTYIISRIAKQHVTVALTGDGGDEFFLGYPQYLLYKKIWNARHLGKLPLDSTLNVLSPFIKNKQKSNLLGRSKSLINALRQPNGQALNRYWIDKYRKEEMPLKHKSSISMPNIPILQDVAAAAALWDAANYLPDDILVKVDRASMANSLETRAPLLDHRILEFSYRLPIEFKIQKNVSKAVLREVLYRYVPKPIVDRPKMGFSIPLGTWLRKELRPWVESELEKIPQDSEHFSKYIVHQLWKEHLLGYRDHTEQLWGIMSLLGFLNE